MKRKIFLICLFCSSVFTYAETSFDLIGELPVFTLPVPIEDLFFFETEVSMVSNSISIKKIKTNHVYRVVPYRQVVSSGMISTVSIYSIHLKSQDGKNEFDYGYEFEAVPRDFSVGNNGYSYISGGDIHIISLFDLKANFLRDEGTYRKEDSNAYLKLYELSDRKHSIYFLLETNIESGSSIPNYFLVKSR